MTYATILASAAAEAAASSGFLPGVSLPDATVIGAIIASAVMTFFGLRRGEEAKKIEPPPQPSQAYTGNALAAAIVGQGSSDSLLTIAERLGDLAEATRESVEVSREQIQASRDVAVAIVGFTTSSERRAKDEMRDEITAMRESFEQGMEELRQQQQPHPKTRGPR